MANRFRSMCGRFFRERANPFLRPRKIAPRAIATHWNSFQAARPGGRLAGITPPALPGVGDTSFAAAQSRVETALGFVKSLTRAQVDGAEGKVIAWTAGGNDRKLKGSDYLQQFALPNFFFFVTTAYNILRHRGVPIGKRDFLGPVNWL